MLELQWLKLYLAKSPEDKPDVEKLREDDLARHPEDVQQLLYLSQVEDEEEEAEDEEEDEEEEEEVQEEEREEHGSEGKIDEEEAIKTAWKPVEQDAVRSTGDYVSACA